MKALKFWSMLLLAITTVTFFAACGGDDDEPETSTNPNEVTNGGGSGDTGNPDATGRYEVGPAELLYGAWGAAGQKRYEFTRSGEVRFYYVNEETGVFEYETDKFSYNEETHILDMGEDYVDFAVTALTPTLIRLTIPEEGTSMFLSRINDNDENTIGPLSKLYGKKLTMIGVATLDDDPTVMTLTVNADGTARMTANSMGFTYKYTYDETTHNLCMYIYGEKTHDFIVIRLTDDVLIVRKRYVDEGVQKVTDIEYRNI